MKDVKIQGEQLVEWKKLLEEDDTNTVELQIKDILDEIRQDRINKLIRDKVKRDEDNYIVVSTHYIEDTILIITEMFKNEDALTFDQFLEGFRFPNLNIFQVSELKQKLFKAKYGNFIENDEDIACCCSKERKLAVSFFENNYSNPDNLVPDKRNIEVMVDIAHILTNKYHFNLNELSNRDKIGNRENYDMFYDWLNNFHNKYSRCKLDERGYYVCLREFVNDTVTAELMIGGARNE